MRPAILLCGALLIAVAAVAHADPVTDEMPPTGDAHAFARYLEDAPADPLDFLGKARERAILSAARQLYETCGHALIWLPVTPRTYALLRAIEQSGDHGLQPDDYRPDALRERIQRVDTRPQPPPGHRFELELALTQAFFLLASDLATGRIDPRTIDASWHLSPPPIDLPAVLARALRDRDIRGTLDRLAPSQRDYAQLQDALQRYRRIADTGGWERVPAGDLLQVAEDDIFFMNRSGAPASAEDDALTSGDDQAREAGPDDETAARVLALRRRLARQGYLAPFDVHDTIYDAGLADAVRRFQTDHGLAVDGVVGPSTLNALNVPAADRVHQIALNMERWRWLPAPLGDPHIRVNVAAYRLGIYEGDREIDGMPVIVGRRGWSTPFFSGDIDHVELNPYWHVPRSIALETILPRVREDPAYLEDNGFAVFDGWGRGAARVDAGAIDWHAVSASRFPYRFRQEPGPRNALGRIKFMFPNQYSIYLHDTPDEHLFETRVRALSHGCIRVAQPLDLAAFLFRNDPAWGRERIQSEIGSGRHQRVDLPEPIPVYLLYWTTFVDQAGRLQFRPDIYGVDEAQARALEELDGR